MKVANGRLRPLSDFPQCNFHFAAGLITTMRGFPRISRFYGLNRYSLAAILAAAFVLMTLLSVQQQRVINAQQDLIHTLARDSFAYLHMIAQGRRAKPPKNSAPAAK